MAIADLPRACVPGSDQPEVRFADARCHPNSPADTTAGYAQLVALARLMGRQAAAAAICASKQTAAPNAAELGTDWDVTAPLSNKKSR